MPPPKPTASAYRAAGVDLDAGDAAMKGIAQAVTATYTPQVLAGLGAFGGLFNAASLKVMDAPVLVASTDGVGTKTKVAAALGRFDTLGEDLVNHCVNDLLVQGARPLFFLDYVASAKLEPTTTAALVGGVAAGCRAHGIPLLGGETAELPGVYEPGEFDLAGTLIGVVERAQIITGEHVRAGDRILGLASGGLQTNGFSLARQLLSARYDEPLGGPQGQTVDKPWGTPCSRLTAAFWRP
jgi:phosphoribosylformylglycinamidine cyclo-ligase